jgi:hypothetical protein
MLPVQDFGSHPVAPELELELDDELAEPEPSQAGRPDPAQEST